MADNYLEKRYEEVFRGGSVKGPSPAKPSLETLLRRAYSADTAGFNEDYLVHPLQVEAILGVLDKCGASSFVSHAFFTPDLSSHPQRIIISSAVPMSEALQVELGSALSAMTLKAAELGLSCRWSLDTAETKQELRPGETPVCILYIGKSL